jgi:uncharacterized protein HemX
MSRNRMKNSQSLHWMGVVKWVLISGLVAGLGLVYMLCKNQNLHLAAETHRLQLQLATIETRNKELNGDLEGMKSLKRLQARLTQMHSNLVAWGDPSANWVAMEQNPRARVAPMGTTPKTILNFDSTVVTSTTSQSGH